MSNTTLVIQMLAYNHERYIAQAIESAIFQKTNFNYKLIICEDFSTDSTRKICKDYKTRYPDKIELVLNEKNYGVQYNALQVHRLCSESNAKYVSILEGDDFWTDRNKLQLQIDFLEQNTDYSMCFHNVEYRYENSNTPSSLGLNSSEPETTTSIDLALRNNYIPSCSIVYRNNYSEDFFNIIPHIKIGDWFLNLYNSQFGKIKYIPKIMAVYRIHQAGSWSTNSNMERKDILLDVTDKLILFFKNNSLIKENLLKGKENIINEYSVQPNKSIEKSHFFIKLIKSIMPFYIVNKLHFKKTGYYLK